MNEKRLYVDLHVVQTVPPSCIDVYKRQVLSKNLTKKIPHSLCGEGILRKYGVPVGIAVIVGSHHGSTPEYYSDIAEENIETYGKDVFFGQRCV